jgi:acyl-CoA synthetase (NDP forming)
MKTPALSRLFSPKAVAVFGSVKPGRMAGQIVTQLLEGGYLNPLVCVNPRAEAPGQYPGLPALASLDAWTEKPDLAVIAVPAEHVSGTLEACGRAGVPFAVVLSAGFAESGNQAGEERLKELARHYNIRVIGPNCAGIMHTPSRLFASIENRALPGRIAFISQSGAVGGAVLAIAGLRGIGFSTFVSYGNRADIGEVELLHHLASDPATDVVAMYLESITDGRAFLAAAAAVSREKPFIIIKAGRSRAGERAAGSHTGSLAGSDAVFTAACRQSGALRAEGIEELLDLCSAFQDLPLMQGGRLAIVTNSGGPAILTADRAEAVGLEVAEPGAPLRAALSEFLSERCSLGNPFDLTVEASGENFERALRAVLEHDYDGAIAMNVGTPFIDSRKLAEGIAAAAKDPAGGKPVAAVFMAGEMVATGARLLAERGVPLFPTGERAGAALAGLSRYASIRRRINRSYRAQPAVSAALRTRLLPFGEPVLEPELVEFLNSLDFPLPPAKFAATPEEAEAAAAGLGFPLVMKVVSPRVLHKSDRGGVLLDIRSAEQARQAFLELRKVFAGLDFRGAMLYTQLQQQIELILGVKRDSQFGPVVLLGAGGVLTEMIRDVSVRIAPLDREEADEMIDELTVRPLLEGFRGRPRADRAALAGLIVRTSELACVYPEIQELDFNPLFAGPEGCVIGDARLLRAPGAEGEESQSGLR